MEIRDPDHPRRSAARRRFVAGDEQRDNRAEDDAGGRRTIWLRPSCNAKAKLLRRIRPEQQDPNIAAALAAAGGKSTAPKSLSERLAPMKAR